METMINLLEIDNEPYWYSSIASAFRWKLILRASNKRLPKLIKILSNLKLRTTIELLSDYYEKCYSLFVVSDFEDISDALYDVLSVTCTSEFLRRIKLLREFYVNGVIEKNLEERQYIRMAE
jgi:hypothetical protein